MGDIDDAGLGEEWQLDIFYEECRIGELECQEDYDKDDLHDYDHEEYDCEWDGDCDGGD